MRAGIPRGITYLTHQGKMLNNKKTIEENSIGAETTIEMSLRLLGGTEENDMKDSFKSEEERENQRKMEETRKRKSTRLSDEALFA